MTAAEKLTRTPPGTGGKMEDGKHTKGPWRAVAPKGRPSDYTSIVEGPDGIMVLFAGSPARTDEEIVGNAVLAAAAPDLVEALKEYREALMMGPLEIAAKFGPDFNPDDILIEADKKAVAALSKAGV